MLSLPSLQGRCCWEVTSVLGDAKLTVWDCGEKVDYRAEGEGLGMGPQGVYRKDVG